MRRSVVKLLLSYLAKILGVDPREFLLHRSKLIPPPVLGFERFEENKYTSIKRRRMIVQCKEEDVEKNGYTQTHTLTCNILTQSSTLYWAG